MSFISSSVVLRAGAALIASLASTAAAEPAIYNLGTLGGQISNGRGVNDAGQVAGLSRVTSNMFSHAFRYDYDGRPVTGGVMIDIGTLGGTSSEGNAVNNAGQVAGWADLFGDNEWHAFRYDGTPGHAVMHDLGTLGGRFSFGEAVNDAGQVAGFSDISTSTTVQHAFRYDGTPGAGGIMRDLGTLGGTNSRAFAVNDVGQVTGNSNPAGNVGVHAFRYDGTPGAGGVMLDLGTLGGTSSFGVAINDAGQVAGRSDIPGNADHAFLYIGTPGAGGGMVDLGTLGGAQSAANGINNAGQVVGTSGIPGGTDHAFLYLGTPGVDGAMIDLDVWLDTTNPLEGAKWTLQSAEDISNTGWITGTGLYDDGPGGLSDGTRAFLLDASTLIPEPGAIGLLAVAGAALGLRRRRR